MLKCKQDMSTTVYKMLYILYTYTFIYTHKDWDGTGINIYNFCYDARFLSKHLSSFILMCFFILGFIKKISMPLFLSKILYSPTI